MSLLFIGAIIRKGNGQKIPFHSGSLYPGLWNLRLEHNSAIPLGFTPYCKSLFSFVQGEQNLTEADQNFRIVIAS